MKVTMARAREIKMGGIDQRRHRLALHRGDDLRVLDVAAQHRVQVAAALAREQRRRVHTGKQVAVRIEGVRQRGSRPDLLVDIVPARGERRAR